MKTTGPVVFLLAVLCSWSLTAAWQLNTAAFDAVINPPLHSARLLKKGRTLQYVKTKDVQNTIGTESSAVKLCDWSQEAGHGKCILSQKATEQIMHTSPNRFTRFSFQFATCESHADEETCFVDEKCTWDSQGGVCIFGDFSIADKNSPCLLESGYVLGYAKSPVCASIKEQDICEAHPSCSWDSFIGRCFVDALKCLYAVDSDYMEKIATAMAPGWAADFHGRFSERGEDFDPSTVLDWKLPHIECPSFADKAACDLTYALGESSIPKAFYCAVAYHSEELAEGCDADSLCGYDKGGNRCRLSQSAGGFFDLFYKRTADFMPKDFDKEVTNEMSNCLSLDYNNCFGSCMWNDVDKVCSLKPSWVFKGVAGRDKSGIDPVCKYMNLIGKSKCADIDTSDICATSSNCIWRAVDEKCISKTDYVIRKAAAEDQLLQKGKATCEAKSTQKKCIRIQTPMRVPRVDTHTVN